MTVSKGKLPAKSGMSQDLQDKGKEGGGVGDIVRCGAA